MATVKVKEIKDRAVLISNALAEGAPASEFGGVARADFDAKIAAGDAVESEIADLLSQVRLKQVERDDIYADLSADTVRIANGVRGDKDFGEDSALYGAMGFVRKSERSSGLTRRTKTAAKDKDNG